MTEISGQMSEVRKPRSGMNHQRPSAGRFLCAVCRSVLKPISDLRLLISTLAAVLFALCGSVEAQQSTKIVRIGFLDPSTASGSAVLLDAFRQELSKLGWIEGKNITIEYRFAENKVLRACLSLPPTWFGSRSI